MSNPKLEEMAREFLQTQGLVTFADGPGHELCVRTLRYQGPEVVSEYATHVALVVSVLESARREGAEEAEAEIQRARMVLDPKHKFADLEDAARNRMQGYISERDNAEAAEARVKRVENERDIAHTALSEAARRFTKNDQDGLRLILCDTNARQNVVDLIEEAETHVKELETEVERLTRLDACQDCKEYREKVQAESEAQVKELSAQVEFLQAYVGDEMCRSDFKSAGHMRQCYEVLRKENERLRAIPLAIAAKVKSLSDRELVGMSQSDWTVLSDILELCAAALSQPEPEEAKP